MSLLWLKREGCCDIADLMDEKQKKLKEFFDRKLPPKVKGHLKATHLAKHYIDVQGHPPVKKRYRFGIMVEGFIEEACSK